MKIPVDAQFQGESEYFQFRFSCESCVLYDPDKDECAHGFPTSEHKAEAQKSLLIFCKDYEMV